MKRICMLPRVPVQFVLGATFLTILLGACASMPGSQDQPCVTVAEAKEGTKPPVVCVAVPAGPADGCTAPNSKKCSSDTVGQSCGIPGTGYTCKKTTLTQGDGTVLCKCQCIK